MSPRILAISFTIFLLPATVQAQGFKAIHNATDKQYQEWVDGLGKDKLHPVVVSGYNVGGNHQFAAIANDDATTAWIARHSLTGQGFQKEFDKQAAAGYRLIGITGYPNGNNVNFAGLWVKDSFQGAWEAYHELTPQEYQDKFTFLSKKAFRPLHVTGYMLGKTHRLAAIFVADGMKDFVARHDQTAEQYQKTFDEFTAQSYRPTCVTAYPTANGVRFAAVFIRDKNTPYMARHDLTTAQYQKEFDKWTSQGYRPAQICGYPSQGDVRFACVFIKPAPPIAKGPPPIQGDAVPELAAVDAAMRKFMQDRSIPAGTLAVMKNGKIVLSHGYGFLDPSHNTLCGPQTPMRIASVTKPITLAALLKLIREGKVSLTTKAFVYLGIQPPPGQKMDKRLLDITVQNLIQHKGGWDRDKAGDPMFKSLAIAKALGKPGPPTADDIIHYMAGQPLQFDPDSKSVYSNFGYCVLGRVIEKASGKKYIDYLHSDVTKPLGLTSIQLGHTLPNSRNAKEPIYFDPGFGRNVMAPTSKIDVPAPDGTFCLEAMDSHGGLIASAPDSVRFLQAYWMNGQPRKDGESAAYSFFGSLPGTWTMVVQRKDGVNIAALFNQRTDPSGLAYEDIQKMLNKAADGVKGWPK
ncbi:MAG TPA: serine hydrolase [Gemmataceae bacterium]|nr:serine hydrolase [Gemmataceae bacterium]